MTILFASGDDGVGCNTLGSRFEPNWPATSAYVTAVGGTILSSESPLLIQSDSTYRTRVARTQPHTHDRNRTHTHATAHTHTHTHHTANTASCTSAPCTTPSQCLLPLLIVVIAITTMTGSSPRSRYLEVIFW